jgi:hypothetical protein
LCPDISKPCIELLVGHYRSRIALIDQLVDELAQLRGSRIPACTTVPSRLSDDHRENGGQSLYVVRSGCESRPADWRK